MSLLVVDALEIVQVEHDSRNLQFGALGTFLELVVQVGPVKDACQRIAVNHLVLEACEDARNRNGDTCGNDGNPVKQRLYDSASNNRDDVHPYREKLEYAASLLAPVIGEQAVDDKQVVYDRKEKVEGLSLVKVVFVDSEDYGVE